MQGTMTTRKVALVTGANGGIGREIIVELLPQCDVVVANYHKDDSSLVTRLSQVDDKGASVERYQADVSDRAAVELMVNSVVDRFGPISVLVNNAGIMIDHKIEDSDGMLWERVFSVNLRGAVECTRHVLPNMPRGGCIVNVLSMAAFQGTAPASYVASKSALWGLTLAAARELAPRGIRVNAVTPGIIDTPFHSDEAISLLRAHAKHMIPLGRIGTASNVAHSVAYLVSADYVTGANIVVSGGAMMS
jgi:3-oxoacyl-[acyl-carrier protein] reductase